MLIAEIGINHHGENELAKVLIKEAKIAKCDAVKLQFRGNDFYNQANEIGDEILEHEIDRTSLSINEIKELKKFAHSLDLKIGISVFRLEDCIKLEESNLVFDFWKVPSAEADNLPLISYLIEKKYDVFVSTGGGNLDYLADILRSLKHKINVMHCIANYPALLGSQSFDSITTLKKQGWKSVGYSSHDEDYEAAIFAMSYDIDSLERHIVLDKNDGGLDSSSSSTPIEFQQISNFYRQRTSLHAQPQSRNQGEILNLQNLGTSLYAKNNFSKGKLLEIEDFDVRAPRKGISPGAFSISSKKLCKPINAGEALSFQHISNVGNTDSITIESLDYFKSRKIGIPVRTFDFFKLHETFNLGFYEFHLSYKEIMNKNIFKFANQLPKSIEYSVHCPDYVNAKNIIDLFSSDKEIKKASELVLSRVQEFASILSEISGKPCNIVSSFPYTDECAETFLNKLYERISIIEEPNCKILPQWLPRIGWYFGGAVKIQTFNNLNYIELIQKYNFDICLDICHLIMSANSANADWNDWLKSLFPFTKHVHLADAVDTTGEGLQLGTGEFGNTKLKIEHKIPIILEVWQGHLNEGAGFMKDLTTIYENKTIL